MNGPLDPEQGFFTLGTPTGACDLSNNPISVTCVYPITVASDAVNIDELDNSGGEFAYVFRTKVTDSAGNVSDEAIRGYIIVTDDDAPNPPGPNNRAPKADFSASQEEDSLEVKFSAQASSDPDGDKLSYSWDFGDGSSASSRDYTKTYAEAKDYQVKLTVSDGQGGEDTETKTITVEEVKSEPEPEPEPKPEPETCTSPVNVPDEELERAIRRELDKLEGELTCEDLASLETLGASYTELPERINNLEGLQFAVNLTELDVSNNRISNFSPITSLAKLQILNLNDNDLSNLTGLVSALEKLPDLSDLNLANNNITDFAALGKLTALTKLNFSGNSITDLTGLGAALEELPKLTDLALPVNDITDLSPLAKLPSLTSLNLAVNNVTDLSPLANLTNLTDLDLFENNASDLGPLANLTSLTNLGLGNNAIANVAPLANLTSLINLDLSANTITDIASLVSNSGLGENDSVDLRDNNLETCPSTDDGQNIGALVERGVEVEFDPPTNCGGAPEPGTCTDPVNVPDEDLEYAIRGQLRKSEGELTCADLSSLEVLYAGFEFDDSGFPGPIGDLEGLQFAVNLIELNLESNYLNTAGDFSPLAGLSKLQILDLSSNGITDPAILENLPSSLTEIDLSFNDITNLSTFAKLKNLTRLSELSLRSNGISNPAGLENLPASLTVLDLAFNEIINLTPFEKLPFNLTGLNLFSNDRITDISPLANLTSLTELDLRIDALADIGPLANLTALNRLLINGNSVEDISPLVANSGLGAGDFVALEGNPLETCPGADDRRNIDTLIERGVEVRFDEPDNCARTGGGG